MEAGTISIQKYKGYEDVVFNLVPRELYVRLSNFKGVEFYGTPFFLGYFIPAQEGVDMPGFWEAHWVTKASGIKSYRTAKKVLAEFFKHHYNSKLIGITDCKSKESIKMARLLGFRPTGQFLRLEDSIYVLSIKEGEN